MIQYSQPPCQDHEIWYYPHELWIHNVQRVQSLKLDPTAVNIFTNVTQHLQGGFLQQNTKVKLEFFQLIMDP